MPLVVDIQRLRDRALAELSAAHDYFTDTKIAWELVRRLISSGKTTFSITNKITGSVTTPADLAGRSRGYVVKPLAEATFQTFLAVFEAFFADLLRAWLRAYPQYLMPTEPVDFPTIYHAPDKATVLEFVIDRKVQGLLYKKPADWFRLIEEKLQLGSPTSEEVGQLAEAKALRDVLIHNSGVANEVYVAKAGDRARFAVGEKVDISDPYHREVWSLLRRIVADLSAAMIKKFP
jgi:hypothetical protein